MTDPQLAAARLYLQKITHNDLDTPQAVVGHLGAVQAQDYPMSKWAVSLRLPSATDAGIEAALDAGALVRTHVLRPTWHLVAGADVRWMLALTGKHIKASSAARDRDLGIDAALYARANDLIVKALEGGKNLTREEVMAALERGGLETNPSRAVHFMMNAETDALVCNGVMRGKEQTYALLDEKIPLAPMLPRDEAIHTLAQRYFGSHAPATLADFHWWSGLPMPDARTGLESIKSTLDSFDLGGKTFFLPKHTPRLTPDAGPLFLPAFDEYCVSYKDRSNVFRPEWQGQVITANGIFRPIIVVNGMVEGLWKRTVGRSPKAQGSVANVSVETTFFSGETAISGAIIREALRGFGDFLGMEVVWKES